MNAPDTAQHAKSNDDPRDWWRGAVIYQIYPRSFQDSNGDGIGDLNGITQRLPYVASLGVDAIWISPFFKSPMRDFGYDVSDYRDVAPMFGTMSDFVDLLARAHDLGLKVMIDLVLSHGSDQHPWFVQSRADRDNPKSDWYVWADPKPDGTPPNNWLSVFGGSAWQWDAQRLQYYLHNFLPSQPDLNFHCPAVQDALLDVAKFWLDLGVDGFRLDTVNYYFHDKHLRDNPAVSSGAWDASVTRQVNPYNFQDHLYSKSQPENLAFLERLRGLTDQYEDRACLGEIGDAQRGLDLLGAYTLGDRRLHMSYVFEFLGKQNLTAAFTHEVLARLHDTAPDAWPCWAFSNHDVERHASRWQLDDAAVRQHVVLMMCLRGAACLYQGEELGLPEADVAFEDLQDPFGIEFWPKFKGRDGCRTPMVWTAQDQQAGFSTGKPWLPVSSAQAERAVDRLEVDPDSILHHYRRAIALRHAHPALASGALADLAMDGPVLRFVRENAAEQVFCAFNLGSVPAEIRLPTGDWVGIGQELGSVHGGDGRVNIPASGFCVMMRAAC